MLTAPYAFTVDEAVAMAEAGADVLVPDMELDHRRLRSAPRRRRLDDCVPLIQEMQDAARRVSPDVLVPLPRRPDRLSRTNAAYVIERTEGIAGFFGVLQPRGGACPPRSR